MTSTIAPVALDPLAWQPQPAAAQFVDQQLAVFVRALPDLAKLQARMLEETGTRLVDWLDHFQLAGNSLLERDLVRVGYAADPHPDADGATNWRHSAALVPVVRVADAPSRLAIKVDSVRDFLFAQGLDERTAIDGLPLSPYRSARVDAVGRTELWAVERHGYAGFATQPVTPSQSAAVLAHGEALLRRRRAFPDPADGFAHAVALVRAAQRDLNVDWACDLFFAAERAYWQCRNAAGAAQSGRPEVFRLFSACSRGSSLGRGGESRSPRYIGAVGQFASRLTGLLAVRLYA